MFDNGFYYSFSTHDIAAIGRSSTLLGYWSRVWSVLSRSSIIDFPDRNDIKAPDVHKVGVSFHLFFAVSIFGSQTSAIGLATSKTLGSSTWTDHGQLFASGTNTGVVPFTIVNAINPKLFVDLSIGEALLTCGSFFAGLRQVKLSKNLSSVADLGTATQVSIDSWVPPPEEGSYLKWDNGWCYLWLSDGICCGYVEALPTPGTE